MFGLVSGHSVLLLADLVKPGVELGAVKKNILEKAIKPPEEDTRDTTTDAISFSKSYFSPSSLGKSDYVSSSLTFIARRFVFI